MPTPCARSIRWIRVQNLGRYERRPPAKCRCTTLLESPRPQLPKRATLSVDLADSGTTARFSPSGNVRSISLRLEKKVSVMKRKLILALLPLSIVVALPSLATASGSGRYHGVRVFHVGSAFWGGGFRRDGAGLEYHPYYDSDYGYGYSGCWRWVGWPYPHRVYVCY